MPEINESDFIEWWSEVEHQGYPLPVYGHVAEVDESHALCTNGLLAQRSEIFNINGEFI